MLACAELILLGTTRAEEGHLCPFRDAGYALSRVSSVAHLNVEDAGGHVGDVCSNDGVHPQVR